MNKSFLIRFAGASLLALAAGTAGAQGPAAPANGAPSRQAPAPVTWDELEHAGWIADGRDDAPRKIYVFLDANCPYCTKFWSDARPWVDSGKVQLRHVMVAVISQSSVGKAATLMTDPDPARRLAAYEQAHAFGIVRMMNGGPKHSLEDGKLQPLAQVPDAVRATLVEHERLLNRLRLKGTPGIAMRGPDGAVVAQVGVPPQQLSTVLGPR
jgi:thiol:disulfide interchange protein DsbG